MTRQFIEPTIPTKPVSQSMSEAIAKVYKRRIDEAAEPHHQATADANSASELARELERKNKSEDVLNDAHSKASQVHQAASEAHAKRSMKLSKDYSDAITSGAFDNNLDDLRYLRDSSERAAIEHKRAADSHARMAKSYE